MEEAPNADLDEPGRGQHGLLKWDHQLRSHNAIMDVLRIGKNTLKLLRGKEVCGIRCRDIDQSEHRDVEELESVSKVNLLAEEKRGNLPW
jgi:hypothetical protein